MSLFESLLISIKPDFEKPSPKTGFSHRIDNFFSSTNYGTLLVDKEKEELHLARETRNCYIHNNGNIDTRFVTAYKNARGDSHSDFSGKSLSTVFPELFKEIETWNELISSISKRIEEVLLVK